MRSLFINKVNFSRTSKTDHGEKLRMLVFVSTLFPYVGVSELEKSLTNISTKPETSSQDTLNSLQGRQPDISSVASILHNKRVFDNLTAPQ